MSHCTPSMSAGNMWNNGFENPRLFKTPFSHLFQHSGELSTHPYLYLLHSGKVWHLGNFSWHWYNNFLKTYPLQFSAQTLSSDDCFHRGFDETLDGSWHSHFSLLIFCSLLETRQYFKKKLEDQFINSWIKANLILCHMGNKSSWLKSNP